MDDKTYQRLLLHTESLRFIVTDLETTIRLAQELEPTGAFEGLKADDAITKELAAALTTMLVHVGKVEERVVNARERIKRIVKLCNHELEFAAAEQAACK